MSHALPWERLADCQHCPHLLHCLYTAALLVLLLYCCSRWYRDPSLPILRTEITRFPLAVLEIKLSLAEGEPAPDWVAELVESG